MTSLLTQMHSKLSFFSHPSALEAAVSLGGEDLIPFYNLLDGGRDGEFFRVI